MDVVKVPTQKQVLAMDGATWPTLEILAPLTIGALLIYPGGVLR